MSPPLISKAAARYTGAGGREHCSLCRHFSPRRGGRCARVLGDISPRGWCRLFSREMRGLVADASSFNGGGGGPTLSLDFMTPGTLSPLITFTRASTGTYFDSAGVMQTAAVNTPRWDYDPATLQLRGLLLEDQRQNMLPQSDTITGWTGPNTTKIAASGVGPAGTNTMVRQQETATTSNHLTLAPLLTIVAATVYTFSVYAKAQQNRYLQLVIDDNTSNGVVANFDLQTGTISSAAAGAGTATSVAATIQAVNNGIYRCSVTCATNATTTGRAVIALVNTATAAKFASYAGSTANGLLTWGAQFEAGDFGTSHIPTVGSAVTRSIDSCLIPPANMAPWFVSPGGSWFAEFDYFDATPPNGARVIARGDNPVGASPIIVFTARTCGQYDGTASMSAPTVTTAGSIVRVATTWATGSVRACANGGTIGTSATPTTGYGTLATFGARFLSVGTSLSADGHLRAVRYWPAILTDAQMQAMTA
jgi:hypothetical protein